MWQLHVTATRCVTGNYRHTWQWHYFTGIQSRVTVTMFNRETWPWVTVKIFKLGTCDTRNTAATYGRQSDKQGNTIRLLNWEIRRWPTHVTSFSMLPGSIVTRDIHFVQPWVVVTCDNVPWLHRTEELIWILHLYDLRCRLPVHVSTRLTRLAQTREFNHISPMDQL